MNKKKKNVRIRIDSMMHVYYMVIDQVVENVRHHVDDQVRNQVRNQFDDQVRDLIWYEVRNNILKNEE